MKALGAARIVWIGCASFALAIVVAAVALLLVLRQEIVGDGGARAVRLAAGAAAAINNSVLTVDLPLAGLAQQLLAEPALMSAGGRQALQHELDEVSARQLLARDIAWVDAQGQTLVAPSMRRQGYSMPLPTALIQSLRELPNKGLHTSSPEFSAIRLVPVLYFARAIWQGGQLQGSLVIAVAAEELAARLTQGGEVAGTELLLLRDDGRVLASVPAAALHGKAQVAVPGLPASATDAVEGKALLGGEPALLASHATLQPGWRVVAGSSLGIMLKHYRAVRLAVSTAAALFVALLLLVAWLAQRHLARLARAQAETMASKAMLEQALGSMHDGFLLCDAQDRVQIWNERYLQLFPWLRPVLRVGVDFRDLAVAAAAAVLPKGSDKDRADWVSHRLSRRDHERTMRSNGDAGWSTVHAMEQRTPDGSIVSLHRDSTSMELELARMTAAAEAANRAKSRFLAVMSHEIRTPLNAVLGMNGLLLSSPLNAEQRRHAELIRSSGQTLLALINDILDLSKIEAGRMELERVDFNLAETVSEVVSLLEVRAQAKGLALLSHLPADLPARLRGDPGRLRQLLFNLIGNALKFTEQGRVEVRLAHTLCSDGDIELSIAVSDTGVGIPAEVLPRLFEPFQQADSSTSRRYGGTGLGLVISRQIAQLMGGRIEASSVLGQGSVFTATLKFGLGAAKPPAEPSGYADVASTGVPAATHRVAVSRTPRRILVAEDNAVNQILIKAMLDRLGHFSDIVADGLEVVRQVRAAPYDLVLMDIQMPLMDGEAAARAIRSLPGQVGQLPIIAMTANAMPDECAAYAAAGMNGHVSKPLDLQVLADAIDQASAATSTAAAPVADLAGAQA